ncbi:type II toxin-antitoxin system PemK/MazF family toxin [Streptomyces sp. WAC8370]|uniref:type II toxin-antitoxin system PemK/MazF family toxin n=1 Tax=Streptomyces TaxID=1883 RepID=UPI0013C2859B|nr:type II toxin-antitoxin system PemK/MazF family toxin [Streptomyces ardesiacus]MCL7368396.1 type II toxin-antitoxin system PemK/MazF family toxin [Streptomyces ardesiacus]NEB60898.1 type II toxin-antitoxin system PemK/MazF family toxin [Streptomyces diastaticus]
MQRGEVWLADVDERRPVVLLSGDEASGFRAMQVVAPAGTEISGVAVEVAVGAPEGLPLEGVLRVALPRPGLVPCTWLVTLAEEDLTEQVGVLSSAKLGEVEDALRAGGLEWTAHKSSHPTSTRSNPAHLPGHSAKASLPTPSRTRSTNSPRMSRQPR